MTVAVSNESNVSLIFLVFSSGYSPAFISTNAEFNCNSFVSVIDLPNLISLESIVVVPIPTVNFFGSIIVISSLEVQPVVTFQVNFFCVVPFYIKPPSPISLSSLVPLANTIFLSST